MILWGSIRFIHLRCFLDVLSSTVFLHQLCTCVCVWVPPYCFPFQASLGQVNQKASSHEILTKPYGWWQIKNYHNKLAWQKKSWSNHAMFTLSKWCKISAHQTATDRIYKENAITKCGGSPILSVLVVLNMDYGVSVLGDSPISCEGSLSRFKVQGNFLFCSSTNCVEFTQYEPYTSW